MLNKFKRLLIILCCIPLLNAAVLPDFQISGVGGDVLLNVERRLSELYKDKSIANEPTDALQLQIAKALYPYGLFSPHIEIDPGNKNTRLFIHIIPGPQMFVTSLNIGVKGEGSENPIIKRTLQKLPIKAGQPLNTMRYDDAKEKLANAAESQGYLHASFEKAEILIDKQQNTAKITLLFNTGPQYYFGQVRFDPTYISPKLLRRYLPFQSGKPYSPDQLLALNTNLSASGYFNVVNVKPLNQEDRYVPIDVQLQPSKRVTYSLGAGYGTDTGPRGLAGLHVIPVNRYGHKFNAIAQGSFQENALQAQYLIPGRNPVTDNYGISGGITNLDYATGRSNAWLSSLTQQHVLSHYQRILSINGLYERYNYAGLTKKEESLIFPKAIFSWNKSSDPLFSPSGFNVTLLGLAADRAILSDINLAQVSLDAKLAFTLAPLRTRFYLHGIQGFTNINNVNNIPLSLAQLLGGATNLKGYSYNSLGPGKIMSYGGIELQKETFKKWYLLGFFDSGDVYKPSVREFKHDLGIGLMWVSPVGPIKIGVAQPVTNSLARTPGSSPKLFINMGPDLS